jgi:hypothetical protein
MRNALLVLGIVGVLGCVDPGEAVYSTPCYTAFDDVLLCYRSTGGEDPQGSSVGTPGSRPPTETYGCSEVCRDILSCQPDLEVSQGECESGCLGDAANTPPGVFACAESAASCESLFACLDPEESDPDEPSSYDCQDLCTDFAGCGTDSNDFSNCVNWCDSTSEVQDALGCADSSFDCDELTACF